MKKQSFLRSAMARRRRTKLKGEGVEEESASLMEDSVSELEPSLSSMTEGDLPVVGPVLRSVHSARLLPSPHQAEQGSVFKNFSLRILLFTMVHCKYIIRLGISIYFYPLNFFSSSPSSLFFVANLFAVVGTSRTL